MMDRMSVCCQSAHDRSSCYVYTELTGGCFAQIKPKFRGNTSLFTKNYKGRTESHEQQFFVK